MSTRYVFESLLSRRGRLVTRATYDEDKSSARKFDEVMATALQAESHFCGYGSGGHRSCEIGFDVPKGVSVDADCEGLRRAEAAAMGIQSEAAAAGGGGGRVDGGDAAHTFKARYSQIGRHQDS